MDVKRLLRDLKSKYSTLGMMLGISHDTIKKIEQYAGDCSRCLNEMLAKYITEKSPNVDKLVKAIADIDKRNLSDTIKSKYAGKLNVHSHVTICIQLITIYAIFHRKVLSKDNRYLLTLWISWLLIFILYQMYIV